MIVQVSPGAPPIVHLAATAALFTHIAAGAIGLASGATALVARKGGAIHRASGTVFIVAILTMAAIGAAMAPLLPQRSSVAPGLLTFYLAATAWLTLRPRGPTIRRLEMAAMSIAVAAVALNLAWAFQAATTGADIDGDGSAIFLVFASMPALGAVLDVRAFARGGVFGPERIRRHIWRICLALLITSSSFFLGQQRVFPGAWRGAPVWFLPELAVIGAMIFWMIKTRSSRGSRHPVAVAGE